MRAVVQRVRRALVRVDGETIGEMGPGLLALVGVGRSDSPESARELVHKLLNLRVFESLESSDPSREARRMDATLLDIEGSLGLVSQFTLFGDTRKGRRPSFAQAAPPAQAEPLFDAAVAAARDAGVAVVTGRFGAMMDVELVNWGPVTLLVDTDKQF